MDTEIVVTATEGEYNNLLNGRPWHDLLLDMKNQLDEVHCEMENPDITDIKFRQLQGVCAGIRKQMELPVIILEQLSSAREAAVQENKGEEDANV